MARPSRIPSGNTKSTFTSLLTSAHNQPRHWSSANELELHADDEFLTGGISGGMRGCK